jgi:O-antigen ligase
MIRSVLFWLCGVVLASSVFLGGGTHAGFIGDIAVELLATPLFVVALWSAQEPGSADKQTKRGVLIALSAVSLVISIQLLPLPFGEWNVTQLLGHEKPDMVSVPVKVWSPLSVSPQATWTAAISLLVPAAVFLSVVQLNIRQRLMLLWLLVVLGAASLLLAFLQMGDGPNSGLRFYEVTNQAEAVGFFANRNHFAAQLYVTLVLGGFWLVIITRRAPNLSTLRSLQTLGLTASALLLVSTVAGLAMTRSRAGIILGALALAGIFFMVMFRPDREKHRHAGPVTPAHIAIVTIVFATLFAAQFSFSSVASRFGCDTLEDLRLPLARTTFELSLKALPFGTGLGTFVSVYASAEKDNDVFDGYANRAHNDLAEFILETGIPGMLLLIAFLIWFCRQSYKVWIRQQTEEDNHELLLRRAATLIITLLLAHSLVDYPLRTTAHGTIFAFFCAICATKTRPQEGATESTGRAFVLSKSASPKLPVEKWGSDMNWPKSWRR